MRTLRLSGFGMRGYVGDSLTPRAVMDYASAFATFLEGGPVLVARDTRYSSPMVQSAVTAPLLAAGCEVVDLGVCPAPIAQFSVPACGAGGAVAISGGHHPAGWNAVMLIGPDGAPLDPLAGEEVLDIFHAGIFLRRDAAALGALRAGTDLSARYFEALRGHLDADAIRAASFRVLVDPVGGAGCPFLAAFAEAFGVQIIPVNGEASGYLAREPEPRPRSARPIAAMLPALQADAGFVFSSDMARLSLVTERGEPVSEEYTFALVARHVLAKGAGPVVANACTSRMVDDLAAASDVPLVKTPVGQAYVLSALADAQGVVGGEGSGSAAVPAFSRAFDGFLAMGLILESLARDGECLSERVNALPRYHIVKRSVRCDPGEGYRALDTIREHLPEALAEGKADVTDGLRLDFADGWVHVRASRTESIIRVLSEDRTSETALGRAEELVRVLEQRL